MCKVRCRAHIGWHGGLGGILRTARERVRLARKLAELPLVNEQLRLGAMSYSQARAISRVATAEKEALWVAYAKRMPASQLDTMCRSYKNVQAYDQAHGADAMAGAIAAAQVAALRTVTRRSLDNGIVKFEVVLPSDEAAIVWAVLNAATTKQVRHQYLQSRLLQLSIRHIFDDHFSGFPTPDSLVLTACSTAVHHTK